jgi:short-subunit dehydrogenase
LGGAVKRHAVVAGASSGIGAAIGAELRRRAWSVSSLARRVADAASADRSFACDVTQDRALCDALAGAARDGGAIDALVWCAATPVMGATTAVPGDAARAAFETSFWAMQTAVCAVLPSMIERGTGALLGVSSLAALRAVTHEAYYAAAKAAAARWLECLALEVEDRGVRVHLLYPGYIETGFLERGGWWGMKEPARVRGSGVTPSDVAHAAAEMLEGGADRRVLGWRERSIVLADRLLPGLYDRIVARRVRRR